MNKIETLQAAEIMRRAAEGEVVEITGGGDCPSAVVNPSWDWSKYLYQILDFPPPPPNSAWHNPSNLNATQVGVHEGWRLLLESEYSGWVKDVEGWNPVLLKWFAMQAVNLNLRTSTVMRTKSPLPEVKADPCEEGCRKAFPQSHSTAIRVIWKEAWNACKQHYKIP